MRPPIKHLLLLVIGVGIFLFPAFVQADFELGRWEFSREIKTAGAITSDQYCLIELDGNVFQNSQPELQDLRIIDEQNKETPLLLITPDNQQGNEIIADIINRQESNGDQVITIEQKQNNLVNGISINSPARNFSRRVTVEGANDGVWRLVRDDGYIMDFSRDDQVRVTTVNIPAVNYRYLRLTIHHKNEPSVVIDGITLLAANRTPSSLKPLSAQMTLQQQDAKAKASILTIKLSHLKIPSSRLELITENSNFHRRVEIEYTNSPSDQADKSWRAVGSGEVYDVALDRFHPRNLVVNYPEVRAGILRVKIHNYDDEPLVIKDVKVFGHERLLLFRREAGRSYRLFYGNEKAVKPQYDLTQLAAYLKTDDLVRYQLGEEQRLAGEVPTKASAEQRNRLLVGVAVLIAVIVLGGLIYRLARANTP